MHTLQNKIDNVDWYFLSKNENATRIICNLNATHILEENQDKKECWDDPRKNKPKTWCLSRPGLPDRAINRTQLLFNKY